MDGKLGCKDLEKLLSPKLVERQVSISQWLRFFSTEFLCNTLKSVVSIISYSAVAANH